MAKFNGYESVGQITGGAIYSVLSARPEGGGPDRFAIKVCKPPPLLGKEQADRQAQRFLDRVQAQKKVVDAGGEHWAPIHASGQSNDGAFYVTDRYNRHVGGLIAGRIQPDAKSLHAILTGVLKGLVELSDELGRPHGNLKPTNILMSGSGKIAESDIALTDPLPTADIDPDRDWRGDLRAVGKLLFELVERTEFRGPLTWAESGDAWNALGSKGELWREHCNALLSPDLTKSVNSLEELGKRLESVRTDGLDVGKFLRRVAVGLVVVAIVVGGVIGISKFIGTDGTVKPDPDAWNALRDEAIHNPDTGFEILWKIAERAHGDRYMICTREDSDTGTVLIPELRGVLKEINAAIEEGVKPEPREYLSEQFAAIRRTLPSNTELSCDNGERPTGIDKNVWDALNWDGLKTARALLESSKEALGSLRNALIEDRNKFGDARCQGMADLLEGLVAGDPDDAADDLHAVAGSLEDIAEYRRVRDRLLKTVRSIGEIESRGRFNAGKVFRQYLSSDEPEWDDVPARTGLLSSWLRDLEAELKLYELADEIGRIESTGLIRENGMLKGYLDADSTGAKAPDSMDGWRKELEAEKRLFVLADKIARIRSQPRFKEDAVLGLYGSAVDAVQEELSSEASGPDAWLKGLREVHKLGDDLLASVNRVEDKLNWKVFGEESDVHLELGEKTDGGVQISADLKRGLLAKWIKEAERNKFHRPDEKDPRESRPGTWWNDKTKDLRREAAALKRDAGESAGLKRAEQEIGELESDVAKLVGLPYEIVDHRQPIVVQRAACEGRLEDVTERLAKLRSDWEKRQAGMTAEEELERIRKERKTWRDEADGFLKDSNPVLNRAFREWVYSITSPDDDTFEDRLDEKNGLRSALRELHNDRCSLNPDFSHGDQDPPFNTEPLNELARTKRNEALQATLEAYRDDLSGLIDANLSPQWDSYDKWRADVAELLSDFKVLEDALDQGYGYEEQIDADVVPGLDGRESVADLHEDVGDDPTVNADVVTRLADVKTVADRVGELKAAADRVDVLKTTEETVKANLASLVRRAELGDFAGRPELLILTWRGFASDYGPKASGQAAEVELEEDLFRQIEAAYRRLSSARKGAIGLEVDDVRRARWEQHAYAVSDRLAGQAGAGYAAFNPIQEWADELELRTDENLRQNHPVLWYNLTLAAFLKDLDAWLLSYGSGNQPDAESLLKQKLSGFKGVLDQAGFPQSDNSTRPDVLLDTALKNLIDRVPVQRGEPAGWGPGRVGWAQLEKDQKDEYRPAWIKYVKGSGKYKHELAFLRVNDPEDSNDVSYICADEVSFGLYLDVFDAAVGGGVSVDALVTGYMQERIPIGFRVWGWDRGAERMELAQNWLYTNIQGKIEHERLGRCPYYPADIDAKYVAGPSFEHPMTWVTPDAALRLAAVVGCRLPTVDEWNAARDFGDAEQNLRGALMQTVFEQVAFCRDKQVREGRGALEDAYVWPDEEIFWPGGMDSEATKELMRENARFHENHFDHSVWFRATQEGDETTVRNLIGNVHELVLRDGAALRQWEQIWASTDSSRMSQNDSVTRFVLAEPKPVVVIGGSALSPPVPDNPPANAPRELGSVDQPQELGVSGDEKGKKGVFSDVGFRLAFTAYAPKEKGLLDLARDQLLGPGANLYLGQNSN